MHKFVSFLSHSLKRLFLWQNTWFNLVNVILKEFLGRLYIYSLIWCGSNTFLSKKHLHYIYIFPFCLSVLYPIIVQLTELIGPKFVVIIVVTMIPRKEFYRTVWKKIGYLPKTRFQILYGNSLIKTEKFAK